jgi:predicted DNA-binding protein (MmcQ/YjbR family)
VLYSHIHYDHFSKDDIKKIGKNAQYFAPLGFAKHFPNDGYHINEFQWNTLILDGSIPQDGIERMMYNSLMLVVNIVTKKDQQSLLLHLRTFA